MKLKDCIPGTRVAVTTRTGESVYFGNIIQIEGEDVEVKSGRAFNWHAPVFLRRVKKKPKPKHGPKTMLWRHKRTAIVRAYPEGQEYGPQFRDEFAFIGSL